MRPRDLTLRQAFLLVLAALLLLLGGVAYALLAESRAAVLEEAEAFRGEVAERVTGRVEDYVYQAQRALSRLEAQVAHGVVDPDAPLAVEAGLFAELLGNPDLAEATLTRAERRGFDDDGEAVLEPEGRWQVSVYRERSGDAQRVFTRFTRRLGDGWIAEVRDRPVGGGLLAVPVRRLRAEPDDPSAHLTFSVPASRRLAAQVSGPGAGLYTDLHHSERDGHLPEHDRRVVVTVMKTLQDRTGRFLGVLRAGLGSDGLDRLTTLEVDAQGAHRLFLCDEEGRLVTRVAGGDRLVEQPDESLRIDPGALAPELAEALRHPALGSVRAGDVRHSGRFVSEGREYLVTFQGLGRTQGWRLGIVVPEAHYLGGLRRFREGLLAGSAALLLLVAAGGFFALRLLDRGLGRVVASTARMRELDFAPGSVELPFRDVRAVMESLEQAKTALRALGKYVPIDLVRLLFRARREPVLGGESADVTLMFTDIEGFTAVSERLPPDELARVLGRYLEVMTEAIHAEGGIIDKYIGDAVMALWNVPTPVDAHPSRAAAAALACVTALERLEAGPEWQGRPKLRTRFGLHRDDVVVGHFGAPDRMSYTALGDGVNLASRLEGLNKVYGTTILASETVEAAAREAFRFRWLDVVAVKGKTRPVRVYELLGPRERALPPAAAAYERAFERYRARDFEGALALLEPSTDDPPSRVLALRCRRFLAEPPPPEWDGSFVATEK